MIYDHLDRVCDCKCFSGSFFWPKHCFNGDLCNPKRETFWTGHNPRCRCRHSSFYVALSLRRPSANGSTSGYLFTPLKLAGAICLIWLSSSLWTAPTEQKPFEEKVKTASLLKLFWKSRVIRILTPKGPAFYVAFVPQFVSADLSTVCNSHHTLCKCRNSNSSFLAFFPSHLRVQFQRPIVLKIFNRIGAFCLFLQANLLHGPHRRSN